MIVEDKNEVIFSQYEFEIKKQYRVRGAIILDTDEGLKIMREYQLSRGKAEFENCIKGHLMHHGYDCVDYITRNREGSLISANQYGTRYVIKDYYPGEECSLKSEHDIISAVYNLARIHTTLNGVDFSILEKMYEESKEVVTNDEGETIIENNEYKIIIPRKDLSSTIKNHAREIKRVRRYICDKKKKNDFEVYFLNICGGFYEQSEEALNIINSYNYDRLLMEAVKLNRIYHGEYTQHNVIFMDKLAEEGDGYEGDAKRSIAVTGFEKAGVGVQISDLYHFTRKTMEKNMWDAELGMRMIDAYVNKIDVKKEEMLTLYALFVFPDKLWKITDYYYNRRKAWISARMLAKLEKLVECEPMRREFLEKFRQEYITA